MPFDREGKKQTPAEALAPKPPKPPFLTPNHRASTPGSFQMCGKSTELMEELRRSPFVRSGKGRGRDSASPRTCGLRLHRGRLARGRAGTKGPPGTRGTGNSTCRAGQRRGHKWAMERFPLPRQSAALQRPGPYAPARSAQLRATWGGFPGPDDARKARAPLPPQASSCT